MSGIGIQTDGMSVRAKEFYGDDVQGFWVEREEYRKGASHYSLYQRPHRGDKRLAARVCAMTAPEALALFEAMAADPTAGRVA